MQVSASAVKTILFKSDITDVELPKFENYI